MTATAPGDPLTERQRVVLAFIRQHQRQHGYPPTIREIGQHLGIKSTNGISDHLRALEKKGAIRRDPRNTRAIVVLVDDDAATLTDSEALDRIARLLGGAHDDASTMVDEIARMVRLSGRDVPSADDPVGDPADGICGECEHPEHDHDECGCITPGCPCEAPGTYGKDG